MIRIEKADVCDAAALSEIYAPYVRDTAITFEYEPPSAEEFAERIRTISEGYPYLKAVSDDDTVIGYAYASAFKKRAAYDRSVEVSIYVRRDSRRSGAGRLLYSALESSLRDMGIINLCACITVPSEDVGAALSESCSLECAASACVSSVRSESVCGLSEGTESVCGSSECAESEFGSPEGAESVCGSLLCAAWDSKAASRVTWDSFRFHERMGYSLAGRLHRIGFKFGCWYDIVWMEKTLGEHKASPDEVRIGDWRLV